LILIYPSPNQVNGGFGLVFGTSASAPVVGAMLTMINDARLYAGKKPIGFINPTVRSFIIYCFGHSESTFQPCIADLFPRVPGRVP
jgi:hypothetical protein